jgi:electron transfer flavoprotein alpha/beta subunit
MKSARIEEIEATTPAGAGISVRRMFKPESAEHAEMLEGDTDEIIDRLIDILRERGVWRA